MVRVGEKAVFKKNTLVLCLSFASLLLAGLLLTNGPGEKGPMPPRDGRQDEIKPGKGKAFGLPMEPIGQCQKREEKKGWIRYPDGTCLPPLNGVEKVEGPFPWPKGRPYSKVIGKRLLKDGKWWYVHEDGSLTTTCYREVYYMGKTSRQGFMLYFKPIAPLPNAGTFKSM